MSHIAERDVAIKIQFPASGARYMQISVLRGNICVGGDGGGSAGEWEGFGLVSFLFLLRKDDTILLRVGF